MNVTSLQNYQQVGSMKELSVRKQPEPEKIKDQPMPSRMSEITAEGAPDLKGYDFKLTAKTAPASVTRRIKYSLELMGSVKFDPENKESKEEAAKNFALAYDSLKTGVNENSDDSQKHSKFIDEAFENTARFVFQKEAHEEFFKDFNIADPECVKNYRREDLDAALNAAVKEADEFSKTFLANYKKHGMDAFDIAMKAIL